MRETFNYVTCSVQQQEHARDQCVRFKAEDGTCTEVPSEDCIKVVNAQARYQHC